MDENQRKEKASKTLGMVSLIFGIISIVSVFCCMPFVFSALGITLALLSRGAKKHCEGQAKTGLICSIVGLAVSFVLTIVLLIAEFVMVFSGSDTSKEFWNQFGPVYEQQYEDTYGQELPPEIKDFIDSMGGAN